jgi:hypothetical protein
MEGNGKAGLTEHVDGDVVNPRDGGVDELSDVFGCGGAAERVCRCQCAAPEDVSDNIDQGKQSDLRVAKVNSVV